MAYSTRSAPKKTKSPRIKPLQQPISAMVVNAIKNLKEPGGSSLRAIKKYMAANYEADVEQLSALIKEYLKTAVAAGKLVQTTGKGASGSFKLAAAKSKKADVPTAPVRGRRCRLTNAPKLDVSNPPKAKLRQKASVKSKTPKASRTKKPAKPKSPFNKRRTRKTRG